MVTDVYWYLLGLLGSEASYVLRTSVKTDITTRWHPVVTWYSGVYGTGR